MIYFIYFFIFIFGLCIGSFLNCLIWRMHEEKSIGGRSICPKCLRQLAWYDNIPVFSFLFLRGKCRHCGKPISWQYPVVEIITGFLFLLIFIKNFQTISNYQLLFINHYLLIIILRDWFLIAMMIIIFVYDLRWYLILDRVSLSACILMIIFNLFLGFSWLSLLVCGIIGAGFFLLQFLISRGRWIGGGDIRLGLLMGVSLGRWEYLLVAIVLGYLIGSVAGIGLIASRKKNWGSQVPLGVFLSVSTIITLFCGDKIINWYFGLF
ncbi:MAG: prepilin peptidase [Patescibacteria group bacterium]|nr:prepilin peptidase [Patescibacteria group bacterium]MDD4610866.1 prepilin peptidase [Patescibacteria group bacterium]